MAYIYYLINNSTKFLFKLKLSLSKSISTRPDKPR